MAERQLIVVARLVARLNNRPCGTALVGVSAKIILWQRGKKNNKKASVAVCPCADSTTRHVKSD